PDQHQSLKHAEGVTTVGIPFLNNPAAPPESVDTYSAQVFSSHVKPAAGAAVQISHPSSSGYGTHQPMQLGPEGKLFLAYPKPDPPQVRNRPRVVLVQFTDKQEPRVPFMRLEPREHKEIHPPQQITFDLVDEDGRPLELSFPATDNPHDPSIPRL